MDGLTFTGAPWAPTIWTPPLTPDFATDGPRLSALLQRHYRLNDGTTGLVRLDPWQAALFTHCLERFPADWPDARLRGRPRYRQIVVSVARQNGKSLIAAGFGLYGLLQHIRAPNVVGVATKVETANIVYSRVKHAIDNDPALSQRLRATGTRGITFRGKPGKYVVRPAAAEGVQSEPVTFGIIDELHLLQPIMWDSLVTGQRANPAAVCVGITTAGDASSRLLQRLYERGRAAVADPASDPRFGFFVWQGPDGADLDNDAHIAAANPAVACGRISPDDIRTDSTGKPSAEVQRYTFNRFVKAIDAVLPLDGWRDGLRTTPPPAADTITFGVARTPTWSAAAIVAAWPTDDGQLWTETVAVIDRADLDKVATACRALRRTYPHALWVMPAATMLDLAKQLRADGAADVRALTSTETANASASTYAAIAAGRLLHPDDLITQQLPTVRKTATSGGAWRITPGASDAHAVEAMIAATYIADTTTAAPLQLF